MYLARIYEGGEWREKRARREERGECRRGGELKRTGERTGERKEKEGGRETNDS